MDLYLFRFEPRGLCRHRGIHGLHLRAGPDRAVVRLEVHHHVERFHRGMRQIRHLILGADNLVRSFQATLCIADLARHGTRLFCELQIFRDHLRRGKRCTRTFIPFDLDQVARNLGRPETGRGNRDPGGHLIHAMHARHRERLACIETFYLAAEHRAARDQHGQHVGQIHIESELSRAVYLCRRIETPGRLADELEVLRRLEHDVIRYRQFRGNIGQRAVAGFLAARDVGHHAVRCMAFVFRNLPLLRRSAYQQRAGSGAHAAHLLP